VVFSAAYAAAGRLTPSWMLYAEAPFRPSLGFIQYDVWN
jgi:hypothetical protein